MKYHNFVKDGRTVTVDLDEIAALDMASQRIVLKGGAVVEVRIGQYEYELFHRHIEGKESERR